MKFNVRIGVPKGYEPDPSFADTARALGAKVTLTHDAAEAARGADVVVTDTWISMGQSHADETLKARITFLGNAARRGLGRLAAKTLHFLAATRGEGEVAAQSDGSESVSGGAGDIRLQRQCVGLLRVLGALGWELQ